MRRNSQCKTTPDQDSALKEMINLYGYDCRVVDAACRYAFSEGFTVYCNNGRYGKRLATGSDDRTATVWDAASGRELLRLRAHTGWLYSVAWSPDGRRLAASDLNTNKKRQLNTPFALNAG